MEAFCGPQPHAALILDYCRQPSCLHLHLTFLPPHPQLITKCLSSWRLNTETQIRSRAFLEMNHIGGAGTFFPVFFWELYALHPVDPLSEAANVIRQKFTWGGQCEGIRSSAVLSHSGV